MVKPPDTKERILNAAENLFAQRGFRATSLRSITAKANVNLAAVNYHFGSKKTLLEEVIKRRILPLNNIRIKRLEEVRQASIAKGKKPDIRAAITAFVEPTLLFSESEPGAKDFVTFISRSFTDPDDSVRNVFLKFIKSLFQLLFKTVSEALPDLPGEVIFWRLQFTLGSLFHCMHVRGNLGIEPMNINTDIDSKRLIDLIVPFVTAGMRAK